MNTKLIIIGGLLTVIVIALIAMIMIKPSNQTQGIQTTYPITTQAISIPTLKNSTKLYTLDNGKKGSAVNGYSVNITNGGQGAYLENNSSKIITSVNVTINNGYNFLGVWIYASGADQSAWATYYQTTQIPSGGYTDTYNIPCSIAPGAGFIVNTYQTNAGEVIFNSVTFD